jgi:uncharacterized membrane protein YqgA involved in biofilm formation
MRDLGITVIAAWLSLMIAFAVVTLVTVAVMEQQRTNALVEDLNAGGGYDR